MNTKYIIVTGGVLSGLGKGIAAASIGKLFSKEYRIIPIKCDGYLNIDPGTMNPVEHGEVFVLDDGSEVDMDFGHYERFLSVSCKGEWNLTMGKVFQEIRDKERRGDFLGKTVQFIPHVSTFIKEYIKNIGKKEKADIVLVEVGGTVGDMENELYLEAVKNLTKDVAREDILFVHLTYVPIPKGVDEQKTKPTQQSVSLLRQKGIYADIIIARCQEMLTDSVKEKISSFCDVSKNAIITGIDVDSVYKIPVSFANQGITKIISEKLHIPYEEKECAWEDKITAFQKSKKNVTIAIAGKYTALEDSYASIVEALFHAGSFAAAHVKIVFIDTEKDISKELQGVDGVIIPGGFGTRGVEGKITVITYCREKNIPFLGICYGLQLAVIEYARNICGIKNAHTTEVTKDCEPVITILEEQKNVKDKGGTMRLGACTAKLLKSSTVYSLYKKELVSERHRHRFEVNPIYHKILQEHGLVLSGMSLDNTLVEFIELPKQKFFVATQAHPELKSTLDKPAPLFLGLVKACLE